MIPETFGQELMICIFVLVLAGLLVSTIWGSILMDKDVDDCKKTTVVTTRRYKGPKEKDLKKQYEKEGDNSTIAKRKAKKRYEELRDDLDNWSDENDVNTEKTQTKDVFKSAFAFSIVTFVCAISAIMWGGGRFTKDGSNKQDMAMVPFFYVMVSALINVVLGIVLTASDKGDRFHTDDNDKCDLKSFNNFGIPISIIEGIVFMLVCVLFFIPRQQPSIISGVTRGNIYDVSTNT